MKTVLLIFGTRPEAVKMAPVYRALERHADFTPLICLTAQHREMVDQVMTLFDLPVHTDLNIMRPDQDLAQLTGRILEALSQVLRDLKPDAVLVQGDTTTSFCGALAAFYARIPVGHVEAGLRTGNPSSPFPEEINRQMTGRLAHWHFAPTDINRRALLKEGVPENRITLTGNPVIDALGIVVERLRSDRADAESRALLNRFSRPFILVTGHRRESFGGGFESICHALATLAENHPEMDILYPVHLNPNVREPVFRILGQRPTVHLLDPLPYAPFVALMSRARLILTDSGGVQEEALPLGRPVLIMRDTTERTEALEYGAELVGVDTERIVTAAESRLAAPFTEPEQFPVASPYGDGHAADAIVNALADATLWPPETP
ncbi:MAG: UDP-N-acetylglucosamine 2-epimerase (non-hydrolyzing) [Magnetococcales bacterium]|nr:UDP-N-acetylglucosamine 2-epimerase (non-hydrolyzing) [Magnetococcales bacterium]